MILWNDFVIDDVCGPVLSSDRIGELQDVNIRVCRGKRLGRPGVMDDACGHTIQETSREQRPARMVGLSGLDSHEADAGMEAGRTDRVAFQATRGEA